MKELDKDLVASLCRNDFRRAKRIAREKLTKDKAQKDINFCKNMIDLLDRTDLSKLEVPSNLQGVLTMESVEHVFKEERYYLSSRERILIDRILNVNRASEKLSKLGINYVNSTLLHGESGTGKTTFGRYLAYRLDIPFAYITFSKLIDSALGSTQKNINKAFDYVKEQNCVFMIDEIDAIAKARGRGDEIGEMARVTITLMQNLDELHNNVILLGATNRIDVLDDAVLRRFSTKHEVIKLNKEERLELATKFFADIEEYEISSEEVAELAEGESTQADLINRMILKMVKEFSKELQNVGG